MAGSGCKRRYVTAGNGRSHCVGAWCGELLSTDEDVALGVSVPCLRLQVGLAGSGARLGLLTEARLGVHRRGLGEESRAPRPVLSLILRPSRSLWTPERTALGHWLMQIPGTPEVPILSGKERRSRNLL